jgi:hypothetical protein
VVRRAAVVLAAPTAGGALLAALVLAGEPVNGAWAWMVQGLFLVPIVLVHCHRRGDDLGLI